MSRNIQLVWPATELILYNPVMIFQKLSVYEDNILASNKDNIGVSSNMFIQIQFYLRIIPPTLRNIK